MGGRARCRTDCGELLKTSDVVCLHLLYDETRHYFIAGDELVVMKRGSFIINTSRGGLIDEEALRRMLVCGHLGGAALDTFERAPYDGGLRDPPHVVMTPHLGSYARAGRIQMERQSVENLLKELRHLGIVGPSRSGKTLTV